MTCLTGNRWINDDGTVHEFKCRKRSDKNPARAVDEIRGHTCNTYYAPTDANLRFFMCKRKADIKPFSNTILNMEKHNGNYQDLERAQMEDALYNTWNERCCKTNYFKQTSKRDQWYRIDRLTDQDSDGGESLGMCEGFELGTDVYIGL